MWNEHGYGGNYFGDAPDGGYRGLADAMASGVDVRLGRPVSEIAVSPDGVRVLTADGRAEEGSHVVVTVPLGVLKRGLPRFSPVLPPDRLAAIERLGFGRFEKVALRFTESFWRDAGFPQLMVFPREPGSGWSGRWGWRRSAAGRSWSSSSSTARPRAWPTPPPSPTRRDTRVGGDPPADADPWAEWALGMLAQVTGRPCPEPTAAAVSSWAADPWTAGAYTHIPPGAGPADADLLGEPLGGRLLFAGEHTQSARLSYADGAMTSGIREAKRLLGTPAVRIAANHAN